jgi:hypothetical protein
VYNSRGSCIQPNLRFVQSDILFNPFTATNIGCSEQRLIGHLRKKFVLPRLNIPKFSAVEIKSCHGGT